MWFINSYPNIGCITLFDKASRSIDRASVDAPGKVDYFNISGEKMNLRNKYDIDSFNIPSFDPETLNYEDKGEFISKFRAELLRDNINRSPLTLEQQNSKMLIEMSKTLGELPDKYKDSSEENSEYLEIVK